jgi:hypothetical protein
MAEIERIGVMAPLSKARPPVRYPAQGLEPDPNVTVLTTK